ncbi:MAG: 2-oxo acid dehydrogenase subunit E2 [Hyphomonadaceae bacterium]|nr:2-oxo acid dehydrogenase subunit E2 [Hyphomonadaceae bacterium]
MGVFKFRMPDVGEGVAEAEVVVWHVQIGDQVEEDQSLVDVMTDKATVDMSSPVDGVVKALHGEIGQMVPVGAVLLEIEVEGDVEEDGQTISERAPEPEPVAAKAAPAVVEPVRPEIPTSPSAPMISADSDPGLAWPGRGEGDAPLASPATRQRAYELGIPLQFVSGTGPGGRITSEDLDAFIARGPMDMPHQMGLVRRMEVDSQKVVGLRRKIAEKMQDSKRRIPHFGYVEAFDLTELEKLRKLMNEERGASRPKLTLLPYFMRAVAQLQPEFPHINAVYDDEAGILHRHQGVHIGIATQTPGGLMVPVVRHAEARDIWDCAAELIKVTSAARDGTVTREMLSGSTLTLTSLGTLGGISATPVINAPEVAIIGPNKLEQRPIVIDGQVVIRTMMNVSTAFDHRIVDGHDAARFVQRLKRLVENPALLFLEQH